MSIPTVTIVVNDNAAGAALVLPQSSLQVVIGCSTLAAGSSLMSKPLATTNPQTLVTNFVGGPLVEAAGLVCAAGGTVIAIPIPVTTKGTATTVQATAAGTSAVTVTLDATFGAWDDYYVKVKTVTGGTRGTAGVQL